MANNLNIDPNTKYFIGAQYINGPYAIPDRETGEVKEGISDKWILTFVQPHDLSKQNLRKSFGSDILNISVKNDVLPFLFGKDPKTFKDSDISNLIGSSVILDFHVPLSGSNARPTLRGIIPFNR